MVETSQFKSGENSRQVWRAKRHHTLTRAGRYRDLDRLTRFGRRNEVHRSPQQPRSVTSLAWALHWSPLTDACCSSTQVKLTSDMEDMKDMKGTIHDCQTNLSDQILQLQHSSSSNNSGRPGPIDNSSAKAWYNGVLPGD